MSHRLLLGLEFDGEYDPRVRAELEQLLAAWQVWQAKVPSNDAEYLVGTATDDLSNERVATNSSTIRVDRSLPGFVRWQAVGSGNGAGGYLLARDGARSDEDQAPPALMARPYFGSTGTPSRTTSSNSSGSTHVHGLQRIVADGATTAYNLLDLAEYVTAVSDAGSIVDPQLYTLSSDGSQVTFGTAPTAAHVLTFEYVVAQL